VALYVIEPVSGEEMFIRNDFTTSGSYFFNLETEREYVLKVQDFNRKEKTLEFNTFNITRSDTLVLDALIVNTIPNEPIIVKNVYYEFAMSNLTAEAKRTIDKTIFNIMKNYPTIVIEISSHTDSVSSDEFNMRLSQDRAQSVVDYLISKGIDRERLVPKGYGESQPIAPNSHPDGTDNPEGRAMNRRTEFRIIGSLNDDTEVIYED
jgi:outer membrane protein OmpA-like peptidoglycan-associated protein